MCAHYKHKYSAAAVNFRENREISEKKKWGKKISGRVIYSDIFRQIERNGIHFPLRANVYIWRKRASAFRKMETFGESNGKCRNRLCIRKRFFSFSDAKEMTSLQTNKQDKTGKK